MMLSFNRAQKEGNTERPGLSSVRSDAGVLCEQADCLTDETLAVEAAGVFEWKR